MKLLRTVARSLLVTVVLCVSLVLIAPQGRTNHRGGSTGQGHCLSVLQRDARVFNNFQDAAANGNAEPRNTVP